MELKHPQHTQQSCNFIVWRDLGVDKAKANIEAVALREVNARERTVEV